MKTNKLKYLLLISFTVLICLLSTSCNEDAGSNSPLFKLLDNTSTGIEFSNDLAYTNDFNVYKYRNFYNGGGVAIGDINNDGLVDVYFVSNQNSNKLYLNEGGLKFKDITEKSGTSGNRPWSTGVSMVDINADGLLDIYVCNSGDIGGLNKANELFINNGDLSFTESAQQYGLADKGFSTHASFFDYDKDGDLDAYILNNSYEAIGSFNLRKNERPNRDSLGGDKLMENRDGIFYDVSEKAGIYGSVIGFGLGVTVSDFNGDNWDDIFVSNDFFERDYLYINNQDGTFTEDLEDQIHSISAASMGADAADIDNDGKTDIFVTDMLPSEYERLKSVTTFDDWNRYQYNLKNGYHHQFTRNMLHHNTGDDKFREVSRYAGVEASDWSWGALFFDMDNDGYKDLYIANGIYKDLTDQDYLQYIANESVIESIVNKDGVNYKELIDIIPSNPVKNQAHKNLSELQFVSYDNSGLQTESFSNGAAYGDLDNDGDLDVVVNNVNMPCFVYENKLVLTDNNYIKLELEGTGSNTYGVGARITVMDGKNMYSYENIPTRGFQSCMDHRPNIGIGSAESCDIKVEWPSGEISTITNVQANQTIKVKESESIKSSSNFADEKKIFFKVNSPISYIKNENNYVDFNRERLVYHMRSNEGSIHASGDINNDGYIDIVIPGAKGYETEIHLGIQGGTYKKQAINSDLLKIKESEHIKALLLDVDNDKDLDLYLASGGVELTPFSEYMYDHLLINDGKGNFNLSNQKLPSIKNKISTGAVDYSDIDNDGDLDLFVGERIKIGKFGAACSSYLLINDGKGNFNATTENSAHLKDIGMVTDGQFHDIDNDGDEDLIVVGEFMDIKILLNDKGSFSDSKVSCDIPLKGWWNTLEVIDIDKDGDLDIIAGNHGQNSRFRASKSNPINLYYSDFDSNGFSEGVMAFRSDDNKDYPYALRHNLIDQMKSLKKRFPDFKSFRNADMTQIFTPEELGQAVTLECNQLKTILLVNEGNLNFKSIELPTDAQLSPIYTIRSHDFDRDGDLDIIMGGNQYSVVPEMGIYDGTFGVYIENKGDNTFESYDNGMGFIIKGELRDFIIQDSLLSIIVSRDSIKTFKF